MDDEPEDIVLDEEGIAARLQDEVLHEGLGDVLKYMNLEVIRIQCEIIRA